MEAQSKTEFWSQNSEGKRQNLSGSAALCEDDKDFCGQQPRLGKRRRPSPGPGGPTPLPEKEVPKQRSHTKTPRYSPMK